MSPTPADRSGFPGNPVVDCGVVSGNDTAVEGRPLDDDAELVRRACAGDVDAYERLVERHQGVAVRVATLLCGPAGAPDATQEAFVKAWRALGRFRADAPFRPWLLRIVANEARNARRGAGRRARLELRVFEDRPPVGAAPSTEEAVLALERRQLLLAALDHLSEADRDVISCRYLADLTEAETAAVLGIRPGTVKSRLSRALGRLREHFDAEGVRPTGEEMFRG
jgi:RNA polymerase sigma factor (sigma-70 family)